MGEKKSFQEILDEQLKKKAPSQEPQGTSGTTDFRFEFDFFFLAKPATAKKTTAHAYPRPVVRATKPRALPAPDQTIEISKLSQEEVRALVALGLKVTGELSRNAFKAKYRELVRQLHPDHHPAGLPEKESQARLAKFREVLEAHQLLETAFATMNLVQKR
jgi:hypothetical protein